MFESVMRKGRREGGKEGMREGGKASILVEECKLFPHTLIFLIPSFPHSLPSTLTSQA
jgi:hypothetical protein